MTKITIELSKKDEENLKSIMDANQDLKTLEDALLWCLRQYTTSVTGLLNFLPSDHTTHIKIGANNRTIKISPRPAPQIIKRDDQALVITGKPSDIKSMISKISKINIDKF